MKSLFDKHMMLLSFAIGGAAAILIVYLGLPHLFSFMSITSKELWISPIEPAAFIGIIALIASLISTFLAYERYRHAKVTGDSIIPFALFIFVMALMWLAVLTILIGWLYIGYAEWLISIGVDLTIAKIAAVIFILLIVIIFSSAKK